MTSSGSGDLTALIPVRGGRLPVGAAETVAEAGGRCWLAGTGLDEAADALAGSLTHATLADLGPFAPARWAAWLAPRLPHGSILLPHGPDGRDLAPRLAATLGRALVAGAVRLQGDQALVARHGGLAMDVVTLHGPVVATLQIGGSHTAPAPAGSATGSPELIRIAAPGPAGDGGAAVDPVLLGEREADRATMDLADAPRIVAAGAGLGDRTHLAALEAVAGQLGASVGGTRVITDWGWLPADRQIGTTGVMVDPRLYLAAGISGAVQHVAGLGQPAHIVAVNTDPSCPMMELADLPLVCDAAAYLTELAALLAQRTAAPVADQV